MPRWMVSKSCLTGKQFFNLLFLQLFSYFLQINWIIFIVNWFGMLRVRQSTFHLIQFLAKICNCFIVFWLAKKTKLLVISYSRKNFVRLNFEMNVLNIGMFPWEEDWKQLFGKDLLASSQSLSKSLFSLYTYCILC